MVNVLDSAGYSPRLADKQQCCGLTWISTGRLGAAKRILGETIDELAKSARAGAPIVGIEPSCTGVLRSDAIELFDNDASREVAAATHMLAELLLSDADWQAPDLTGVSVAVAEQQLLPAVRADAADAMVLTDGFFCRTELADLSDRNGRRLADLLAAGVHHQTQLPTAQSSTRSEHSTGGSHHRSGGKSPARPSSAGTPLPSSFPISSAMDTKAARSMPDSKPLRRRT